MSHLRRAAAMAVAGVAAIVTTLSFTPAAYAAAGPFQIRNFNSDMCIQTDPANGGPNVQLVQQRCDRSNPAQLWFFDTLGGNDYHIINVASFNCMRARDNADRARVETIDCTQISDERFSVSGRLPTPVPQRIISRIAGGNRCLDVADGSSEPGAKIQLFHCTTDNPAQIFTIR